MYSTYILLSVLHYTTRKLCNYTTEVKFSHSTTVVTTDVRTLKRLYTDQFNRYTFQFILFVLMFIQSHTAATIHITTVLLKIATYSTIMFNKKLKLYLPLNRYWCRWKIILNKQLVIFLKCNAAQHCSLNYVEWIPAKISGL